MAKAAFKTKHCQHCNNEFSVNVTTYMKRLGWGMFCSKACSVRYRHAEKVKKNQVIVTHFFTAYPFATIKDCSAETGLSEASCRKYRQIIAADLRQQYKAAWATVKGETK